MADTNFIAPSKPGASRSEEARFLALQPSPVDRLVFRGEYRDQIARISDETLRRWQLEGKLPPFDYAPTQKRQAWKRSTLVAAGHFVPELLAPAR